MTSHTFQTELIWELRSFGLIFSSMFGVALEQDLSFASFDSVASKCEHRSLSSQRGRVQHLDIDRWCLRWSAARLLTSPLPSLRLTQASKFRVWIACKGVTISYLLHWIVHSNYWKSATSGYRQMVS